MGILTAVTRGLVRGADRMSQWTSKRGPRTFNKGRGAKGTGVRASGGRFVLVEEMAPEFVVSDLPLQLKPYVSTADESLLIM
nr:39S ribosomal protein L41, mitochondrial-like [Oryctolagus cuniculus]